MAKDIPHVVFKRKSYLKYLISKRDVSRAIVECKGLQPGHVVYLSDDSLPNGRACGLKSEPGGQATVLRF